MEDRMQQALEKVAAERQRQIEWMSILGEEYGELCEAVNETFFVNATHPDRGGFDAVIKEACHVAAVAVAIMESLL